MNIFLITVLPVQSSPGLMLTLLKPNHHPVLQNCWHKWPEVPHSKLWLQEHVASPEQAGQWWGQFRGGSWAISGEDQAGMEEVWGRSSVAVVHATALCHFPNSNTHPPQSLQSYASKIAGVSPRRPVAYEDVSKVLPTFPGPSDQTVVACGMQSISCAACYGLVGIQWALQSLIYISALSLPTR